MSQRISDLSEVSSLTGAELVEVSVPNGASPTGYTTRSASTSLFGGGGGLPFRFEFDLDSAFLDSDNTFTITFNKGIFASTAFRPNSSVDPSGDWTLATAIMNFNGIAAFLHSEDTYPFSEFAPLNSSVWVNKVGSILGSNDGDRLRWGSYNSSGDNYVYSIPDSPPSGTNQFNHTPVIAPIDVTEEGDFSAGGEIVIRFRVLTPYDGWQQPEAISIKGYVDINMAFSNFYQPV